MQESNSKPSLNYERKGYSMTRILLWVTLFLCLLLIAKCTFNNIKAQRERELFYASLVKIYKQGLESIKLSELTTFSWETVCGNHPYSGDLYLEKYNQTYMGPLSQEHDGTWVLVFIAHDGSYRHIYPPNKVEQFIYIDSRGKRCYSREESILNKIEPYYKLPQYQITNNTNNKNLEK